MRKILRRCCESKRECITYVVILLWIILGIHATINSVNLTDVAAYFLSLTGFIGSFIYGESIRKSEDSSIFLKGSNSKRESLVYFIIVMWLIIGIFAIYHKHDILATSAYFATLTPFVGAFILGETHKAEDNYVDSSTDEQINS
jgi:hypothetical protein